MSPKRHTMQKAWSILAGLSLLLSAFQPLTAQAGSPAVQDDGLRRSRDPQTGLLTFLGADPAAPVQLPDAMRPGLDADERATSILGVYGPEFGISDPARQLRVERSQQADAGRQVTRYQQVYQGIPVLAGELVVNSTAAGALLSISGEVSPSLRLSTTPKVTARQARQTALGLMQRNYQVQAAEVKLSQPKLWIYDEHLLKPSTRPAELVWRMEATLADQPVRELVLVSAQDGDVALHFNQVDTSWTQDSDGMQGPSEPASDPTRTTPLSEAAVSSDTPVNPKDPTTVPSLPGLLTRVLSALIGGIDRFVSTTGTDSGACSNPLAPCRTINYAIAQAVAGDTIKATEGRYTGTGTRVVSLDKNLTLSGGWDTSFASQTGFSTIDGENLRGGLALGASTSEPATVIERFIIKNGYTTSNGGGVYTSCTCSNLVIRNSAVVNNRAAYGGGIYSLGTLGLTNVTVSGNTASEVAGGIIHGGVVFSSPTATLNNVTIANNASSRGGAGIHEAQHLVLLNSILSANRANGSLANCSKESSGVLSSQGNNLLDDTTGCPLSPLVSDQFNVDPHLGALLTDLGYIPLASTSPAIDAGNNATCEPAGDQRGAARADGNGDAIVTCDIGAFEFSSPGPATKIVITSGDGQHISPGTPLKIPLQVVALDGGGNPVPGVEITFAAPSSGPGGVFADTGANVSLPITSDAAGIANAPEFAINDQLGSYAVSATSALGSVDFTLENLLWYVALDGDDVANNCKAPGSPCATLAHAIQQAFSGNRILVAEGTYQEDQIVVDRALTFSGGWDAATFTVQQGFSRLDGQNDHRLLYILQGAAVELTHFIVENAGLRDYGSGINNQGVLHLSDVIVRNNQGNQQAGGITNNGVLVLKRTQVYGNTTNWYGGGIWSFGSVTITDSDISNNSAAQKGGGISSSGPLTVSFTTLSGNTASYGGGVYRESGSAQIQDSILAGNAATTGGPDCSGAFVSGGHNILGNSSGCSISAVVGDQWDVDPQFGPFLPGLGYRALASTSPAIDAADASCADTLDVRNVSRPQGTGCDIGYYEYLAPSGEPASFFALDGGGQYAHRNTDFGSPLRAIVLDANGSPMAGIEVMFTLPAFGASANFAGVVGLSAVVATDEFGVATSPTLTANNIYGEYTVTASVAGIPGSASFTLMNGGWFVAPGGNDLNDCHTPSTACGTINAAINKAPAGETVFIAAGTYTIPSGLYVVTLSKSVNLSGGWDAAFETRSELSTLDGGDVRGGIRVNTGVTTTLEFLLVTNTYGNGVASSGGSSITLNDSVIRENRGTGLYNAGTLTINRSTILFNRSRGISNSKSGTLYLNHSEVAYNSLLGMYAGGGGGIYNTGTMTISSSRIHDNQAYDGGGIQNGSRSREGNLTIQDTAIYGNTATASGGGVNSDAPATLRNVTINNNSALLGAGIAFSDSASVNNTTISGNASSSKGGGIYRDWGTVAISNTIVAHNTAVKQGGDCYGLVGSGGSNIIGNTSGCYLGLGAGDQVNTEPHLGPFLPAQGYIPLYPNSPAIDAGNHLTCEPADQRGAARLTDGKCDVGAYEHAVPGPAGVVAIASGDRQRALPGTDFHFPLVVIVLDSSGTPVPGAEVVFQAPSTSPSATFVGTASHSTSVITDGAGVARVSLRADDVWGSYAVVASSTGTVPAEFSLHNGPWMVSPATGSGNNANDCLAPDTACATIQGVLAKWDFLPGDIVWVAAGTYDSNPHGKIEFVKGVSVTGGWDSAFDAQIGTSVLQEPLLINSNTVVHLRNLTIYDALRRNMDGIENQGSLLLEDSTVRGNKNYGIRGGGRLTMINTTVTENGQNSEGGGILDCAPGTRGARIINSTITNNLGTGGIDNYLCKYPVYIQNTILAGNTAYYGPPDSPDCTGPIVSDGNNIVGNIGNIAYPSCEIELADTDLFGYYKFRSDGHLAKDATLDPGLGPLTDLGNGMWLFPLQLGSLAIDRASSVQMSDPRNGGCPAADQRGVARPQGAACDIGAYEYVPARSGSLLLSTYDAAHSWILPGTLLCDQTDLSCSGAILAAQNAHKYAAGTYDFYLAHHARHSLDDQGIQITSAVRFGNGYDNAFWNGHMLVYGDKHGFANADDVVAHELTHGVTQSASNLLYFYQSGAINESLSDLWGEAYDQLNGMGNDTVAVQWLIGEDITGLGAIRDMKNPPHFGDPDKMSSSYYYKGSDDNGGVHTNSGVNNKAVSLMVQGGTFNGQTVSALGWDKVLAIYYEAQTNLLTPGSDYLDLYNALYQACLNKVGTAGIAAPDCQQVRNATNAVQMNKMPAPGFSPDTGLCPAGMSYYQTLYAEDFKTGTDGWSLGRGWGLYNGIDMLWGDDSYRRANLAAAMSQNVSLPPGSRPYLYVRHAFGFESVVYQGTTYNYDGGILEYSVNNGSWKDASVLFKAGQNYNGTVASYFNSGNFLSGQRGFVGDSHGFVGSLYNLSSLAGKNVRFRWRIGTDQYGFNDGWFIDDIAVSACVPIPKVPTLLAPVTGAKLSNYQPLLDWSDSGAGLDHYQLQVSTNSTFTALVIDDATLAASSYTPATALAPGAIYYWRVRAFNVAGKSSGWSKVFSFKTLPGKPLLISPTNLAVLSNNRPAFDWGDVTGATGYTIQVASANTFVAPLTLKQNVTDSAFTPGADLPAGKTLYWRVRANSPAGSSKWSPIWSFKTARPPSIPSLLLPTDGSIDSSTGPTFDWSNSTVPTGTTFDHYELQVSTSPGFETTVLDESLPGVANSTFTPGTPLSAGTLYYWRVRSYNTLGQSSSWSTVFSFATLP